ncbi:hypothetical protein [Moorena sp. SIO2C4]|uniref:hypothetical protein n=1 Tax=Moorena sp. SIO2C4 TaxID=2607824 RepID=UPI0013CA651B|nr:hypothetical protein [Moorena sp. SIO2C4]NES45230.1 hypothetical protein [Moorena sp. SIO2C4]
MLRATRVGTQALLFFLLNLVLPIGILPVLSYPSTVKPIPQDWSASDLVEQGRAFYTKGQFNQAATTWEQAAQAYESQGYTTSGDGIELSVLGLPETATVV